MGPVSSFDGAHGWRPSSHKRRDGVSVGNTCCLKGRGRDSKVGPKNGQKKSNEDVNRGDDEGEYHDPGHDWNATVLGVYDARHAYERVE
jgi:hypothetical protein